MLRWLARFAVISLGLGAVACETFPDVPVGVCGNHIIDPQEDCDGSLPAGVTGGAALRCGLPGTDTACRYDCTMDATSCPAGFVCSGTDGICRSPAGTFD